MNKRQNETTYHLDDNNNNNNNNFVMQKLGEIKADKFRFMRKCTRKQQNSPKAKLNFVVRL
jgi:hypothetical protein